MPKKNWEYESVKRYQDNFDKAHATYVSMKLYDNTDADILEKLASVDNKQGYIKQLIRADISKDKENKEEN